MPLLLARLRAESLRNPSAKSLFAGLREFGRLSGMFDNVEIQQLGRVASGPFRVRVEVAKAAWNLIDVGYGVSQILPIVVDLLRAEDRLHLIQQPEVHLHPRAQAALGSFFGAVARRNSVCVVETHSDYLIDRVRMCVREGLVDSNNVIVHFLGKKGRATSVSSMPLSPDGSLRSVPKSYREFFISEQMRLFGG